MRAEIVGISFSVKPGEAAYIPVAHNYPDAPAQLPRDEVLAKLKPWLEDGTKKKLGQHVKYDRHVFANHGIEVQGYAHDTMLQSYVLEVHKPHGLASLAERHLGRTGIDYEDLCGKGAHQISFSQVVDRQGRRVLVRGLRPDARRAPRAVAAARGRREAALRLRAGDGVQRSALPRRAQRRADRRAHAGRAEQRARQAHHGAGAGGLRARGPALQPRLAQADRRSLLHQAGPAGGQEDAERRAEHRRGGAGKAGRRLPAAGQDPRAPRPVQAQGHLHRQARASWPIRARAASTRTMRRRWR